MKPLDASLPPNILIVDDMPHNLRLLSSLLENSGYRVRKAISGELALQAAQLAPPDLILLDISLPQMDGYEVCCHLKAHANTRDIPVIFISALGDVDDKLKAFELGGVDYITKPFQAPEVLARVELHLKVRSLQLSLMQRTQELQEKNRQLEAEVLERQKIELVLMQANQELERLARLDGLTGVANRRRFEEFLHAEWLRLQREQQPLSLVMCDVDYFKLYNDVYGHQLGDHCLQQVARAISLAVKRPADLVARYGGEEFAVVLPNTNIEGAIHVGTLICAMVRCLEIRHERSPIYAYVTVSVGVAMVVPHAQASPDALVSVADQALYGAKHQGRNQVIAQCLVPETGRR